MSSLNYHEKDSHFVLLSVGPIRFFRRQWLIIFEPVSEFIIILFKKKGMSNFISILFIMTIQLSPNFNNHAIDEIYIMILSTFYCCPLSHLI